MRKRARTALTISRTTTTASRPGAPAVTSAGDRPRVLVTRAEEVVGERWDDYADRVREAGAEAIAFDPGDLGARWRTVFLRRPDDHRRRRHRPRALRCGARTTGARDRARTRRFRDRDPRGRAAPRRAGARDLPGPPALQRRRRRLAAPAPRGARAASRPPAARAKQSTRAGTMSSWRPGAASPTPSARSGCTSTRATTRPWTPERAAPSLEVTATTADGVVEALERPDRRWAVSVQWHPEMVGHPEQDEMATDQRPPLRGVRRGLPRGDHCLTVRRRASSTSRTARTCSRPGCTRAARPRGCSARLASTATAWPSR